MSGRRSSSTVQPFQRRATRTCTPTLGVPDTLDGRFDSIGLYVYLTIRRLDAAGRTRADAGAGGVRCHVHATWTSICGRWASAICPSASATGRCGRRFTAEAPPMPLPGTTRRRWRRLWPAICGAAANRRGIGAGIGSPGIRAGHMPGGAADRIPGARRHSFPAGGGGRAMNPEFHRPLSLDRIGPHGLDLTVEANRRNAPRWRCA